MQHINITAGMLEEYSAGQYEAVLDDTYRNYDSRLIAEDLQLYEIKGYLEERADLKGGYVSYDYDEGGISTLWVTRVKIVYRRAIIMKGLVFISNKSGRYDVHEFWRQ